MTENFWKSNEKAQRSRFCSSHIPKFLPMENKQTNAEWEVQGLETFINEENEETDHTKNPSMLHNFFFHLFLLKQSTI